MFHPFRSYLLPVPSYLTQPYPARVTMETVKLLLVVVLLVASADAWWLAKEQHSYHACGAALEVFLGDTCKAKWYQNCSSDSCRRRRALDDGKYHVIYSTLTPNKINRTP